MTARSRFRIPSLKGNLAPPPPPSTPWSSSRKGFRRTSTNILEICSGEFWDPNDANGRRRSLSEEEIDEITIPAGGIGEINASGRRGSEGRLDLFHNDGKICELHWENRGGEHINLVETLDSNDQYRVEYDGWSSKEGPLGHVYVDITKIKK